MSDNINLRNAMEIFKDFFSFRRAPNAKQWRGPTIEEMNDFALAVIEFDDQGWYHDIKQRDDLNRYLDRHGDEDLLIVVFIHGWKHNAAPDDANLQSFRAVLKDARLSEDRRPTRRQILGVYLSWRGLSLSGNWFWTNASFWTRKNAASRVAVGSIREILARLRAFQKSRNDGSNELETPNVGTRLIIVGHSFGGLILFTAVSEYLIESVTGRHFEGGDKKRVVRPFGDLVILINPAFEATRYQALYTAVLGQPAYPENQRPCFLAVTARNDLATGIAFPLGRRISTLPENVRRHALSGGPPGAQKEANLNTIGHLRWVITHRLSAAGSPETSPHQAYKGRVSSNFDAEELDFDKFNKEFRRDGHLMRGWKRTYTEGALLEHVAGNPDDPFWIVEATPEVVDGHNGIYRPVFLDFLRQLCDDRLRHVG
jgi:Alpha/beta hydrolase family